MVNVSAIASDGMTGDLQTALDAPGPTWVRITGDDTEEIAPLVEPFGVHQLSIEDVLNGIRPKTEEFDGYTFILVRTAELRGDGTTFSEEVRDEPIGLFVGPDWLVTLTTAELPAVERVWMATERGHGRVLRRGPDFAAYRIIDETIGDYFDLLDDIERRIEHIEEGLLDAPERGDLNALNEVRRDLLAVRRLLWPTQRAVGTLAGGGTGQIQEPTEKYYRDVYDHLSQLVSLTETYRDLLIGSREMYLNALSASTNEVMKTLTVVASIVLPLTLVAGIYGMNFETMPELGWTFAYPAVLIGMAAVALVLVGYFRREGWL
ncbi:MAG TPA: magnesium/cobalt transporter CorA [Halococcus sp.]|nr:magnesium/cobalt transporter CorA [Halococcus sp.]